MGNNKSNEISVKIRSCSERHLNENCSDGKQWKLLKPSEVKMQLNVAKNGISTRVYVLSMGVSGHKMQQAPYWRIINVADKR